MVVVRNSSVMRGLVAVDYYVAYTSAPPAEWIERTARAFNNLMQVPTLFYVVCTLMLVTRTLDQTQLAYAWIFVAMRALHACVYIGWNHVRIASPLGSRAASCSVRSGPASHCRVGLAGDVSGETPGLEPEQRLHGTLVASRQQPTRISTMRFSKKQTAPKANAPRLVPTPSASSDSAAASSAPPAADLPDELIAVRAYEKWRQRGCPMGQDSSQDWFAAKQELEQERLNWAAPREDDRSR
jgi:hypothetical protein